MRFLCHVCNRHLFSPQGDAKASISASYLASNNDQPSPISILEASFSNDSCSFGSHNGSSGVTILLIFAKVVHNSTPSFTPTLVITSYINFIWCMNMFCHLKLISINMLSSGTAHCFRIFNGLFRLIIFLIENQG